jgi:hypothetical protein
MRRPSDLLSHYAVSNSMTLTTSGKFFYHFRRMRGAMALFASFNITVLFRMALNARQCGMSAHGFVQHFRGFSVAVSTRHIGCVIRVNNLECFMGQVAV